MMGRIWAALCVLHVLWLGGAWCSLPNIRGLDPALAEHYKPKGDTFSCIDGQKTIAYSLINDNFCDCFDGSDEPGRRENNFLILQEDMRGHVSPHSVPHCGPVRLISHTNLPRKMRSSPARDAERMLQS